MHFWALRKNIYTVYFDFCIDIYYFLISLKNVHVTQNTIMTFRLCLIEAVEKNLC